MTATKNEIWQGVWKNVSVEETNLPHIIYLLRKTLASLGEKNLIEIASQCRYWFSGKISEPV